MSRFRDTFRPVQHKKLMKASPRDWPFFLVVVMHAMSLAKPRGRVVPHQQSDPEGLSICDSADASSPKSGLPPKPATYSD